MDWVNDILAAIGLFTVVSVIVVGGLYWMTEGRRR